MKPLYKTQPVRKLLGSHLRPGGDALTRHLFDKLTITYDQTVLDAGCGAGTTLELLQQLGVHNSYGVDMDHELLLEAKQRSVSSIKANISTLPLPTNSFDAILCECAWNLSDKEKTLTEFQRILRPKGKLALSDIYYRNVERQDMSKPWPKGSCFYKATDLEKVQEMVVAAGFDILSLDDHTSLLKQTAAECIFAHGSLHAFWNSVIGDSQRAKNVCTVSFEKRPGLFLLIAKRKDS